MEPSARSVRVLRAPRAWFMVREAATMQHGTTGLVAVGTEPLERLLRAVHRRETLVPVSPGSLAALGLQDWSESLLGCLRGLDEPAVRAVLVAVLAERHAAASERTGERR
jgi:hypothetical protein